MPVLSGRPDIDRAADGLASRLPDALAVFARLAYNYRWAWMPDGPDVFRAIDPDRWRTCSGNPVRLLQEASAAALARAAADEDLLARADAVERAVREDLDRPARTDVVAEDRPVAYFCAEYAVHASLPIYSGGLGALAGDHLKEASDFALPLVAVGLMYRRGYFRQRIDHSGWQQEFWVPTDPERTPAVLVRGDDERAGQGHRARRRRGRHRAGLARGRRPRPALPARHRPAREHAASRAGSPSGSTTATRAPGWRSTSCSAPAASPRCGRWASSPASCT